MSQFPPNGFIETTSAVDGVRVFMPAPDNEKHEEIVAFRCPQCNGEMAFSAVDGGISCGYCGYHEAPDGSNKVGLSAESFEFKVSTMQQASHGWGVERKEIVCQTCTSHIVVEEATLTTNCPFCQSNKVIQHRAPQDVLRPRFLIPFVLDDDAAHSRTRSWLGDSWLVPKQLRQVASIGSFIPMYLPYWTFDADASATWKAEVGRRVKRTNWKGESKTVTEWSWESGRVAHHFKNVKVNGSNRLNSKLMRAIHDYDLNGLRTYDPSFLAGTQAIAYEGSLEDAWALARGEMRNRVKKRCENQATTSNIRNFSMELEFGDEAWRYVLLPVYIANYHFQNKPFQLLVNGQTGAVAGQRPADWRKIGLLAAIPILIGALLMLWQEFIQRSDANTLSVIAALCFISGIVIALALAFLAGKLDES